MKKILYTTLFLSSLFVVSCSKQPQLRINLSDKFEGENVEIITLLDSTVLASQTVKGGIADLIPSSEEPSFTTVTIDGRTRAFYITEPGKAFLNDSLSVAQGTPLNDKFSRLLTQLDSIEQYDDMSMYMEFVEKNYNENKDNPIGSYFGIEWLKYAEPEKIDSMLALAPDDLKNSAKARHYQEFGRLRAQTSPGNPYIDFEGENENGNPVNLSDYVKPGNFTVVDFWASWCPYCIKEMPDLKNFYDNYKDKGVEIIGVAVRDMPGDTQAAVNKQGITWPVIYNVQRKPYDIYGFSGIPHHILIGPDGKIISRGENISQIEERIKALQQQNETQK